MRSNRSGAAAPARKSHVCAFHARATVFWRARGTRGFDLRAAAVADARFERIVVQRFAYVAQPC
eukprot:1868614-Lingulodinium_polyedra.AAC.1